MLSKPNDYWCWVDHTTTYSEFKKEMWAQSYPNDLAAWRFLGLDYLWLGRLDKSLANFIELLRREPNDVGGMIDLSIAYLALDRLDDSQTVANKVLALDPHIPHAFVYRLGFVRGDSREMQNQLGLAEAAKADPESLVSAADDTAAYYGKIEKQRPIPTASMGQSEQVAISQLKRALWEAEFQLRDASRRDVEHGLASAPTRVVRFLAALALARIGDTARSDGLENELEKHYPADSLLRLYVGSSIRAAAELGRNNPVRAIELLEAATPSELSTQAVFSGASLCMYPEYLRGMAYLSLQAGNGAAIEFQKLLDHRGLVANCPLGALAHLQIGRAYAMAGDTAKAKSAYQDFLTLWKDADPDIPLLKEAKVEYAKLQ